MLGGSLHLLLPCPAKLRNLAHLLIHLSKSLALRLLLDAALALQKGPILAVVIHLAEALTLLLGVPLQIIGDCQDVFGGALEVEVAEGALPIKLVRLRPNVGSHGAPFKNIQPRQWRRLRQIHLAGIRSEAQNYCAVVVRGVALENSVEQGLLLLMYLKQQDVPRITLLDKIILRNLRALTLMQMLAQADGLVLVHK